MATPYELYMEAQKRRKALGGIDTFSNQMIETDRPPTLEGMRPIQSRPETYDEWAIRQPWTPGPGLAPAPVIPPRFTEASQIPALAPPPAPILPMPTPGYSASESTPPEISTLDKMNQTSNKVEPPKEGFISKLGRGAVSGLTELFKGIRMGPKGYEEHQQYLERLPYEKKAYEEKMALETAQRKGESDYDYSNRLKLAQETAKLKPIITLDQEIDNTMKYMGMLTADNKITGKKEIVDPTRYNALANQLDELLKKREASQSVAPQSSGAIGGANTPANPQANAEMIAAIQSLKKTKTADEIRKLLMESGEEDLTPYEPYFR